MRFGYKGREGGAQEGTPKTLRHEVTVKKRSNQKRDRRVLKEKAPVGTILSGLNTGIVKVKSRTTVGEGTGQKGEIWGCWDRAKRNGSS